MSWFFRICLAFTLGANLACAARGSGEKLVSANSSPSGLTNLRVGDIIEVRVFEEEDLTGSYQIADDGRFNFPLIGLVQGEAHTPQQVAIDIQNRLGQGFLRNPHVMVLIKERQNLEVTVLGEVQKPGSFAYKDGLTVVQAISLAGGLTRFAAPRAARLTHRARDAGEDTQKLNLSAMMQGKSADVPLQPGDTLFVPESPI